MKRTIAAIAIALAVAGSAFAKKHQTIPIVAHEYKTATITMEVRWEDYDSSSHVTVDGQTYGAYCKTTDTSISCTDNPAHFFMHIKGEGLVLSMQCDGPGCEGAHSDVFHNPFLGVVSNALAAGSCKPSPSTDCKNGTVRFQYRLVNTQQEINAIVSNQFHLMCIGKCIRVDDGTISSKATALICIPVEISPSYADVNALWTEVNHEVCYDWNLPVTPVSTKGIPDAPDLNNLSIPLNH